MTPVSLARLREVFGHMEGRVGYLLGAKAPRLDCDSAEVRWLDCSGFVRYVVAKSTDPPLMLPDGSVNLHAWCEAEWLHRLARYADVARAAQDSSRLFIAFISPRPAHPV